MKYFQNVNSLSSAKSRLAELIADMKYFDGCPTLEQAANHRRKLAKKHHSDTGSNSSIMAEINAEYDTYEAIHAEYADMCAMIEKYPHLFPDGGARVAAKQAGATIAKNFRDELRKKETRESLSRSAGTVGQTLIESFVNALLK